MHLIWNFAHYLPLSSSGCQVSLSVGEKAHSVAILYNILPVTVSFFSFVVLRTANEFLFVSLLVFEKKFSLWFGFNLPMTKPCWVSGVSFFVDLFFSFVCVCVFDSFIFVFHFNNCACSN